MSGQQNNINYGDAVEPIAIIGMSCRFPGQVSSPQEFWDMLANGRSGHCEVPASRFNVHTWYHPDHDRKGAIQPKSGFFLDEDISLFDAPFFSITAKEAMGMDPMQRYLLEVAYECFENAGVPIEKLKGSMTSVYTGVMTNDYELVSAVDIYNLPQNAASGTSRAMLSNRVSWFFDLRGPSLTLDTACSSSLYALHLACQSVRLKESSQALVTGVNLILHPNFVSQLSSMHMLSPDGISHSFDESANGYGRGEAVGAVLVKPLSQALADGDIIRAVIRGSGANQDGKTPGITMPSREAQADLIRRTYATAGLSMADTSYFEAHGTGTKIGDPTELSAIGACFGPERTSNNPLYVGSVKTNVGHTEGMAGLAGVIKTVLSLETAMLPELVGFETINPKLLLDNWKLALPLKTMQWPTEGLRRASVNGFGFGGSNAHVILDDAYHYLNSHQLQGRHCTLGDNIPKEIEVSILTQAVTSHEAIQPLNHKLLVFSMQDQNGLQRLSKSMAGCFSSDHAKGQRPMTNVDDLAYTLASRRSQFNFRSFAVCNSIEALTAGGFKSIASTQQRRLGRADNVIFVFTGQGAQWPLMGRELLADPVFNSSVQRSQQYLDDLGCSWDAADLLHDPGPRINIAEHCQPICTILQVALIDMLAHWGITPSATVGHSSGEIAAAYAAGGLTHKDAIKIAYMRGYYCGQVQIRLKDKRGAMMAAGLTTEEAQSYIEQVAQGSVVIGCVNSPTSVTLSGDVDAISYLEGRIKYDGKFARKLRVEIAYHSSHMHSVSEDFLASIGEIEEAQFKVPMFSSVTTEQLHTSAQLDAAYWVTNMVSAVRFSEAVNNLLAYSTTSTKSKRKARVNWSAAVEIGPHEALKGPFNQCATAFDGNKSNNMIPYTSLVRRGERADKSAKEAAGLLWSLGHSIDVNKVNNASEENGHKLKVLTCLPPYPWQHSKSFWHEPAASASARLNARPRTDLLGIAVDNQNAHEPRWKNYLRLSENPWIRDHAITGTVLYPAAGMIIMVVEAALQISGNGNRAVRGIELHDIHFDRGLVIPDVEDAVETSLSVRRHETLDSWFHWTVYSVPPGGSWSKHCFGLFALVYDEEEGQEAIMDLSHPPESEIMQWEAQRQRLGAIKERATKHINPSSFYSQLETIGMGYGPSFTNLTSAVAVEGEQTAYGTVVIPDTRSTMPSQHEFPHVIHPATLDAIFHLLFIALFEGKPMHEAAIPVTVEKLFVATHQPTGPGSEFIGFSTATKINDRDASGNIVVSDQAWSSPKVLVTNMVVRKVSSPSTARSGTDSMSTNKIPKRIAQLQWKEDVDLLSRAAAESMIRREEAHYLSSGSSSVTAQAAVWLERACHKDANLKVLAIVDSKSSSEMTIEILSLFGPRPGKDLRFDTCVIASSTEDLLSPLRDHGELRGLSVQYQLIDLEGASPEQQNQELGPYDIVIADIRSDDDKTSAHITTSIAPDGKLVAVGLANDQSCPAGVENKAVVRGHAWENMHFDKVLAQISSDDGQLLIATHSIESQSVDVSVVYIVEPPNISAELAMLKQNLSELFSKRGIALEFGLLSEVKSFVGQTVICLLEAEEALVMKWTSGEFEQFRDLVFSQSYVLWVTRGGFIDCHDASLQFAPTTGLLRTLRTEVPQIVLGHVDLSPSISLAASETAEMLFNAFHATSKPKLTGGQENEMELVESGGSFFIPRAVGDDAFDEELNAHSGSPVAISSHLSGPDSPLMLLSSGPSSSPTEMHWAEDPDATRPLDDDEVEVKTTHLAVSSADLDTIADTWQSSAGRAASGIVTRVGSAVQNFAVHDEVYFPLLGSGGFKTRLRQHQTLVSKLQEGLSLREAASLPSAFLTAYYCLTDVARVLPGERVLIHLVSSGESQAAVQLALALSAEVFVTVTSATEKSLLVDRYKIAEERIFDSASRDLGQSLAAVTEGKGFDAIISDHGGVSLRQASLCLAELGRFVDISRKVHASDLSMGLFKRNISFSTVDMQRLGQAKFKDLFQKAVEMLREGSIAACTSTSPLFSISSLDAVWNFLASSPGTSAVVSFDDDATVPILPAKPPPLALNQHATYVIAGGLGALGLTIAQNMVEHGARHLVLLSRSGITSSRQSEAVERLRKHDCVVDAVSCDVTDEAQVAGVINLSKEKGWLVKGLVQCAMVLKDSIFENMTFENWLGATQPKIKGTWNLHRHLPDDLDFFVVLSSMSGIIGNAAQANYSAGNAYEDAVAHYRHARGLKATTLNVGLVTDASHFTAASTIDDYLKQYGHWASALVADRELQITLEAVMRGHTADGAAAPVQLLVGITDAVPRGGDGLNPWSKDRKFDHRAQRGVASFSGGAADSRSLADELNAAGTARDAVAAVEYALRTYVAAAMTASPEEIDAEKPLYSFGIDSLKAIQVRNWLFKELGCDVSVFDILSPIPVGQLASSIARRSSLVSPEMLAMIEQEGL